VSDKRKREAPAAIHPICVQLHQMRLDLRLTQDEVSRRSGVWQSSISDYETGKSQPTLDSLDAWASALGLRHHLTLHFTAVGERDEALPVL
jgi:transcriptional regulator with XRE-family HTH domain